MNKEQLLNNIANKLRLSDSEKEFAFRTLVSKIVDKLLTNEALKIEEVGVFQLKKEPLPRQERTGLKASLPREKSTLIYSPPFNKLEGDISSVFLTIDLAEFKNESSDDIDSTFSISVGKPLISLSNEKEESRNFATNLQDRRELDIELKIHELVSNGILMRDYDIWEDYLSERANNIDHSDRDEDSVIEDVIKEETFNEEIDFNDQPDTVEDQDGQPEETSSKLHDDLRAFEEIAELGKRFTSIFDPEDNLDSQQKSENDEENIDLDDLLKKSDSDEILQELETEEFLPQEEPEDVHEVLENQEVVHDEPENAEDVSVIDEPVISSDESDKSMFDELEEYLKEDKEIEQLSDEIERNGESKSFEELIKKNEKDELELSGKTDKSDNTNKVKPAGKPFYKNKWFYLIVLVGVVAIASAVYLIYNIYPADSTETQTNLVEDQNTNITLPPPPVQDTTHTAENVTGSQEVKVKEEVPAEQPPVEKVIPSEHTGLYRKTSNDSQAANQIFFDGKDYTVQVSSWKSAAIAEREVERLRKQGFDAFIYQVFLESRGSTWNRVRIGYFKTLEEAEDFLVKNKF